MLDTELLAKVYELKEQLINCDEYKRVKNTEMVMEDKCSILLLDYTNLMDEYNNALRFEKYGSDVGEIQKKLYEKKLELDNNEYVKEYYKAYKEMRELLNKIQNQLFKGIIDNKE